MATNNLVIVKLDPLGQVQWVSNQPSLNTNGVDEYPSITVDTQGNTYAVYYTQDNEYNISIIKLNSNGVKQWAIQQPSFNTISYHGNPYITVDNLNNLYLTYCTDGVVPGQTTTGQYDIVVIKLDTTGSIQWIKQQSSFNTSSNDMYPSITTDISGNIFVSYITYGVSSGQTQTGYRDLVVFKLEPITGNTLWVKQIGFMESLESTSTVILKLDENGNVLWTQQQQAIPTQPNQNMIDTILVKIKPDGQTEWISQKPTFTILDTLPTLTISPISTTNVYTSYATNDGISIGQFNDQPPCYNQGTQILTINNQMKEIYIPIENIKLGMIVKTYRSGNRRVEHIGRKTLINNPSKWNYCMYKLPKKEGMIDDLIVTGGHSILVDHPPNDTVEINRQKKYWGNNIYVIKNKYLVMAAVSKQFVQLTNHDVYNYYHLVLEHADGNENTHFGIWANGVLSESQSLKDFKLARF